MGEMHDKSDLELLRDYAAHTSEAAFRELVARHTDLVYSAALRQVESSHTAADIAQSIFLDLARKASHLIAENHPSASIVGWLHRATRYAVLSHLRDSQRQRANERQAMEQLLTNSDASVDWEQIRPTLDEALDQLGDEDREALLLRYFKNQNLRAIGQQLGVSEDAMQKRVSRALEKLRDFFSKRGIAVGSGGLALIVSANAVQAAPAGLVLSISTAAFAGTAVSTTVFTTASTKIIAMTTIQKVLIASTAAILAGAVIYESHQAAQLRHQMTALQQQQAPLVEENRRLRLAQSDGTNQSSDLLDELARAKKDNLELLKLRSEVGLLREQTNLLASVKTSTPPKAAASTATDDKSGNELVSRENYAFAGYAAPEATVKSLFWAASKTDTQTVLASMSPLMQAQTEAEWAGKSEDQIRAELSNNSVSGYRIVDTLVVSDNEKVLTLFLEGRNVENKIRIVRVNGEWKIAGKPGH